MISTSFFTVAKGVKLLLGVVGKIVVAAEAADAPVTARGRRVAAARWRGGARAQGGRRLRDWARVVEFPRARDVRNPVLEVWEDFLERHNPGLSVIGPEVLPVEKVREALGPIALDDPLSPVELRVVEHRLGELAHAVLYGLVPSVDDVDAVALRVLDVFPHEAAEPGQVGGHIRDAHDGALCRRVTPGLVITEGWNN